MLVLVARYYAKSGHGDQVAAALHRMAPLVRAHEPGCKLYQANRSIEHPDFFLLYEQYVDDAALQAHRVTPHFKEIIEGTIAPILDKREREIFRLEVS
jgi:autoinducer 2-degrading protein